ncbi:carotenoid ester lipase precursor [Rickenella mellea]|uniref:Carboxylic ester hydrolase n=1 Tax=Rickenella mellea TaxID=50990 RepID=A0A4Y7PK96_9AGAM|nr:carotenoid ester lipase precursor [Rickenella mellea]
MFTTISLVAALAMPAFGVPVEHSAPVARSNPVISLDYGSFKGTSDGKTASFLGMPFAQAPFGDLRFAAPQPPVAFSGVRDATFWGAACPQQQILSFIDIDGLNITIPGTTALVENSEDCLFVNVVKPASISSGQKLPVVFWIFGGGFELGDSSGNPGNSVVERSMSLGEPIIYVSANYRLNAFGFLPGKEAKAAQAGNAGLKDQRFALQWVQKYISNFGGDPTKVTIWGESAGAISVAMQMVTNDGDPQGLFRGGFMVLFLIPSYLTNLSNKYLQESGSPLPLQDIETGQVYYDQLVADAGCSGSADTLACLRSVPFKTLKNAVDKSASIFSYQSLEIVWQPRVDGVFLKRNPQTSVAQGLYAKVPFVSGDCDDEGTLFSLFNINITTDAQFTTYIRDKYFGGSDDAAAQAAAAYTHDITTGSPYNTGVLNAVTPQFKRLAAFQGDVVFQAPRRFFMQAASQTQDTWAFLYARGKALPILGSFHVSDLSEFYGTGLLPSFIGTDALINFVNTLNPNGFHVNSLLSLVNWKKYSTSTSAPPMLKFSDPAPLVTMTTDTYRSSAMQTLIGLTRQLIP